MRHLLLLISVCNIVFALSAQQTLTNTIIHDGIEREYILYIPDNYTGDEEVPLIFNFHGFGGNAQNQMENGDFRSISDTAGFIIAHPQGTLFNGLPHWNVGGWTVGSTVDDVGFVDALLDTINSDYNIDLTRVYSTGMSNGGFFSFLLACQLSERIAAIASVTGSMTPQTYDFCNPAYPMAIQQYHGTFDIIVPYNGADFSKPIDDVIDYWVGFNNCTSSPIVTYLPDLDPNDGSTVEHYSFEDGDDNVVTEHFKIIGGGHTWPGSAGGGAGTNNDIDASVEIWKFFKRFERDIETTVLETSTSIDFKLFPNPANETITIENLTSTKQYFTILTMSGVKVLSGDLTSNSTTINISKLPKGVYFVVVGDRYKKLVVI